jgi:hypothetical protein
VDGLPTLGCRSPINDRDEYNDGNDNCTIIARTAVRMIKVTGDVNLWSHFERTLGDVGLATFTSGNGVVSYAKFLSTFSANSQMEIILLQRLFKVTLAYARTSYYWKFTLSRD